MRNHICMIKTHKNYFRHRKTRCRRQRGETSRTAIKYCYGVHLLARTKQSYLIEGGFSWVVCGEHKKIQKSGSKNVFCITYLVIRNVPSVVSVRDRVAKLVFACRQGQRVSTRRDYLRLSKKCYYAVCYSNMWPPCSLRRRGNLISSPGPVHRGALCLEWIHRAPLLGCKHLGPRSSKGEPGCTALPLVFSSTSNIISLILPFMSLLYLQKKKKKWQMVLLPLKAGC